MLSWVVRDLYGVEFEATVALAYIIDASDVGAHFINHLHELWKVNNEAPALNKWHKFSSKRAHYCLLQKKEV